MRQLLALVHIPQSDNLIGRRGVWLPPQRLYRDDYYNLNTSDLGVTEVNVAKNRDGRRPNGDNPIAVRGGADATKLEAMSARQLRVDGIRVHWN
jgi:hypothetical protein